jgi:hypothetical protein
MAKAVWITIAAGLLQAAQPIAAGCLPPDQVAERMDEYFANPRAPATYRALAGMGDPRIKHFYYDDYDQHPLFGPRDDWEGDDALRQRMFPVERIEMGGSNYVSIERGSCRAGYALAVARERTAALGAKHPYVEQWLAVQRAVFSACAGRGTPRAVPRPPPRATADPAIARLQRDDRAYQQASRQFYEESHAAHQAFRRIAASASPHAPIARYMLLVLMAERPAAPAPAPPPPAPREAGGPPPIVAVGDQEWPRRPPIDAAAIIAEADRILADPRLARIHPLVQGLIGSLAWRHARDSDHRPGDPPDPITVRLVQAQVRLTLAALKIPAERLRTDPIAGELYARAAQDVGGLHGKFPDPAWWLTGLIPEDAYASRAMAAAAKTDRFAAWLLYPLSPFRETAWGRAGRALDWDSRLHWVTSDGHSRDSLAWTVVSDSVSMGEGGWGVVDDMSGKVERCADDDSLIAALPETFYHEVRRALTYPDQPPVQEKRFAAALDHLAAWPWRDTEHYRETVAAALRYLVEVGRIGEARRLRDRLLTLPPDDNRYDTALLLLAEDEAHFAAALAGKENGNRWPLLNILSVAALQRLAERPDLTAADKARFARVGWSRLYALGRPVPARLDRLMRRFNPEIVHTWKSRPGRGAGAGDRLLLLDVLRSPGLNILITDHQRPEGGWRGDGPGLTGIDTFQHSDNNWWCAWQSERHEKTLDYLLSGEFFSAPAVVDEEDADPLEVAGARRVLVPLLEVSWLWAQRDGSEERALSTIPCAPKLLTERAIAWKGRRGDGQAEALALAVRATRYGCQRQGGHGAYSRKAFALLHSRYPGTPAAKRTRYWFD